MVSPFSGRETEALGSEMAQEAPGWKSLETCHEPSLLYANPGMWQPPGWTDGKLMLTEVLLPQLTACPVPHTEIYSKPKPI